MTHIKKSLSIVLALLMLISVFAVAPITASAAETNIQEVGATYSGTTGDCTWNLNTTTGLLSISGTGAMGDYSWTDDVPWYSYRSYVKTVTISSGVTSIDTCAFYDCTSLTSVTIPSSVTSIGWSAFRECTSLTNITIPSSVTSIGDYAFSNCTSLTSITIPSSVTSIGMDAFNNTAWYNNQPNGLVYAGKLVYKYKGNCPETVTLKDGIIGISDSAFSSCYSLTSITIPSSVTSIGDGVFYRCTSLTSIDVDSNNDYYCSMDGNLYNKDKTTLKQYAIGKTDTSFTIPSSVTNICEGAFEFCYSLTSITIPSSVTGIGDWAFYMTGLTSITIPNSVTSIGDGTFEECTSLTSITIPSSVTSIGYRAFNSCGLLTSVTIPSSVTNIGNWAFGNCTSLNKVYYTGTASDWSNISIGSDNTPLTNATKYYSTKEYDYSINNNKIITVSTDSTYKYIAFIPEKTGEYTIYSSGSYDTYGYISDYSGTDIDFDDDSGVDYNFSMTVNLTEGELYLIGAKLYDSDDIGSFTVTVTDGTGQIVTEPTEASSETEPTEAPYETILLNESKTVNISTAGDVKYYQFIPSNSGTYEIYSSGDYDTYGNISDYSGTEIDSDDDSGLGNNFSMTVNLTEGELYLIGAKLYDSDDIGSFTVTVTDETGQIVTDPTEASSETEPTEASSETEPTEVSLETEATEASYEDILLNESKTVNISTAGDVKYYQFIPEYSGTYQIYSSGDYDTYGYLYDSNMNQLTYNDDGGSEDNFKISYNLTAGTKYIIGAKLYNSNRTGSFTVTVTDGTGQIVTEPTETTVATVETQPTQPITNPTVPILPTQPVTEPTMIFTQSTVPTADIKPTETEPTTEETVPQPTETVPQPTETVPVETQPTQPSETEPTECVHANTITVGAKAATYFAKGYTGSKICTDCGEVVSYGRTVDMKVLKTPKVTVKGAKKAIKVTYSKVKDAKGFTVTYKLGKKTYNKKFTLTKKELKKAKVTKTIKVKKAGKYKVTVKAFTTSGKKTAYSKSTSTKTAKVK